MSEKFRLLPGESLLSEQPQGIVNPSRRLPSLVALMELVGVKRPEEIGTTGPVVASKATAQNAGNEHLRLYEVFFPRDAMYVCEMIFDVFPGLTRTTLLRCAELQGLKYQASSEEEPGRIPHEVRDPEKDKIAQELTASHGWTWPYYGSVDNTPHFVSLVCKYVSESKEGINFLKQSFVDRDGQQRTMLDALQAGIRWIERRRSNNAQGFIESLRANPKGHRNQVWMDSWDSYFHADGSLPNDQRGVSSIEVQGLAYDALRGAADLYHKLGNEILSKRYHDQAEELRRSVIQNLWITPPDDLPFFALGGDHDPKTGRFRPFKVRKSNPGHLLYSRIFDDDSEYDEMAQELVESLMFDDMLCASGIRTCSVEAPRYREGSYHNGSCWLWDTYLIAQGMRKYGFEIEALDLEGRIMNTVNMFNKYPEYARGSDVVPELNESRVVVRDILHDQENVLEQPPQEIQAWTVAAVVAIESRSGKLYQEYQEYVRETASVSAI